MELISYAMNLGSGAQGVPRRGHRHPAGVRPRTRRPRLRRVRLVRPAARRRRQRDDPQRDHPRHARLPRPPRPVGALKARAPATAAEEIVRWATPVVSFQRTATRTPNWAARRSRRATARRDLLRLRQPRRRGLRPPRHFDITRDPNPHLGFGGGGPHFCLGSPWRAGDQPDLRRHRRHAAGHLPGGRAAPAALRLAQRRQGVAGALRLTGGRAPVPPGSAPPAPRRAGAPRSASGARSAS